MQAMIEAGHCFLQEFSGYQTHAIVYTYVATLILGEVE